MIATLMISMCLMGDFPYYEYQIPMLEMYSDCNDMLFIEKTEPPIYRADSGGHWYYPAVTIKRLESKDALDELVRHWPKFNFIEFAQLSRNWHPITNEVVDPNDVFMPPVYPPIFPMVWVTRTGTKFHNRECFYATVSVPQPLDVALNMGLTPCSNCTPLD